MFDSLKLLTSKSEVRVAVVGTMGSGKTTCLACLSLTCTDLSNKQKNFYVHINERTSGILEAPMLLRMGKFPPPTPPGSTFEADILLKWKTTLGDKTIRLPFVETAGEEIQRLISRFSAGMYDMVPADFMAAGRLHEFVLQSTGFILILPVSRALLFQGKSYEPEPSDLMVDPDINLSRLLECIYNYKKITRSKSIKGICVLLTKYDLMSSILESQGMSLTEPEGVQRFMITYFPETNRTLKFYGLEKVIFIPTWVTLQRDNDGNPIPYGGGFNVDGSPKGGYLIYVDQRLRKPHYSEISYLKLIEWLKKNFAS